MIYHECRTRQSRHTHTHTHTHTQSRACARRTHKHVHIGCDVVRRYGSAQHLRGRETDGYISLYRHRVSVPVAEMAFKLINYTLQAYYTFGDFVFYLFHSVVFARASDTILIYYSARVVRNIINIIIYYYTV